ncbi:helix-turn-helix transcriptional regulator [Neobacillus kokaensis]|uniref:Transcriptional regulator n=1 Tax=Neobacillus kokaensis TaxID=2759023 RepID=A0ABQ3N9I0_9BACI|nr:AraC family transcriptional regulator [Neobacillus kokaensis]GHH99370.1 transcriptional regulator [Neobacillus kokaensis]
MPVPFDRISPFVRKVKILKTVSLVGEWIDFDHVLTYIEQGSAEFILNGQKYIVQTGDLVLMHPLLSHIVRSISTEPLIQYIVHFDLFYHEHRSRGELRQEPPAEEMQLAGVHPIVHGTADQTRKIRNLFLSMYQVHQETDFHSALKLKADALYLLSLFFESQQTGAEKAGVPKKGWIILESCLQFIHENYQNSSLDIEAISRHAGFSPSHIAYLFREEIGITIHKYVTQLRMEQAKKLMLENSDSLTNIAEKVGYQSIHAFSRTFKQNVGMTASQFIAYHSEAIKAHSDIL